MVFATRDGITRSEEGLSEVLVRLTVSRFNFERTYSNNNKALLRNFRSAKPYALNQIVALNRNFSLSPAARS